MTLYLFSVLEDDQSSQEREREDWDHTLCRALVLLKQSPWLLDTILDGSPFRHSIPASCQVKPATALQSASFRSAPYTPKQMGLSNNLLSIFSIIESPII